MNITQFTIEEVRCFAERQTFEIRPLTFLVGENSTGKTTVLACFHILAEFLSSGDSNFNFDPYSLGVFGNIVRRSTNKEKFFTLGFSISYAGGTIGFSARYIEKERGLEPFMESSKVSYDDGSVAFDYKVSEAGQKLPLEYCRQGSEFRVSMDAVDAKDLRPFSFLATLAAREADNGSDAKTGLIEFVKRKSRQNWSLSVLGGFMKEPIVLSSSPVRSKPRRTYEPGRELFDPEGSDVPTEMLLMEADSPEEWGYLMPQLERFGEASGLFQRLSINKLGRTKGGPFQLMVKVRGPTVSLLDVGYGVGQVLPILVNVLRIAGLQGRGRGPVMPVYSLIQQPEVHLHPKAQAELSSLLSQLASKSNQSFIVETHSDYMVDRARIEIMQGNISRDDVSLIYLEPKKNIVKVHNISFDEMGNMIGVPPKFRSFFLKESSRLMGFEDS